MATIAFVERERSILAGRSRGDREGGSDEGNSHPC